MSNVPCWRSLELHKHHRALGLAPPRPAAGGLPTIAKLRPVQPVTLAASARRAARRPLLRREVPGPLALCGQGEPVARPAQDPVGRGVTHYDVASIGEVRLVHETLPEAVLCFMHPVKAEEAIAEAYFDHGVRTFSLDTLEELEKIVRATSTDGVRRATSTCSSASASARSMPSSASRPSSAPSPRE